MRLFASLAVLCASTAWGAQTALRLGFWKAEAQYYIDHPTQFPTTKAGADWLQIYVEDRSVAELKQAFAVFATKTWTEEFILREPPGTYNSDPVSGNMASLIRRIQKVEQAGATVQEILPYREPMATKPGGLVYSPGGWSDSRLIAQSDADSLRALFRRAWEAGLTKYSNYDLLPLIYQYQQGSPNTQNEQQQGLDAAAKAFVEKNFEGVYLEINSHDYASKLEDQDAALCARWAASSKLRFGITSGATNGLDTRYKGMFRAIFAAMTNLKVPFRSDWNRYLMHHNAMSLEQTLPETSLNTVTENFAWLVDTARTTNAPPTCKITAPLGGARLPLGSHFDITAQAGDADGSVVQLDLFLDGGKVASKTGAPYGWASSSLSAFASLQPGFHQIYLKASDDDGRTSRSEPVDIHVLDPLQKPFGGTALVVPGKLEFENFDLGGQGVGYRDADAANQGRSYRSAEGVDIQPNGRGGYNLGWVNAGEWLAYTISASKSGKYAFDVVAASLGPDTIEIDVDDAPLGRIAIQSTGSLTAFDTSRAVYPLVAGGHELRVRMIHANGFNPDCIRIHLEGSTSVAPSKGCTVRRGRVRDLLGRSLPPLVGFGTEGPGRIGSK